MKNEHVNNLFVADILPSSKLSTSSVNKLIKLPLADMDILFLQDIFLKNGMHKIKFESFDQAKTVSRSILYSLSCYKNIAYISGENFVEEGFDILEFSQSNDLQDLFLDLFYFDFIYIEKNSATELVIKKFNNLLKSYKFENVLPIIQVEC